MTTPLVILDRQHYGKPGSSDRGAGADLDGDGLVEVHEQEANLTPVYIAAAERSLQAQGIDVLVLEWGSYGQRHAYAGAVAAAAAGPVAYVACHLNAGGGRYGRVDFDRRSRGGQSLAQVVGSSMARHLPELFRVKVLPTDPGDRPFTTIRGIYEGPGNLSGVCYEPCFLDQPEHRELFTDAGLARVGQALGEACLAWIESRS